MYNKQRFIETANIYGARRKPFFFMVDFDCENYVLLPIDQLTSSGVFVKTDKHDVNSFDINNLIFQINTKDKYFTKQPIDYQKYQKAFNIVKQEINYGNTYLINLTFPTEIQTNYSLAEIYLKAQSRYKLLYKDKFVLFSPEPFVKIENGRIYSYPMKGTISADIPNAESILLNDKKEIYEHNTIVDLIRNDLSIVSSNVNIDKYRFIEKLTTNAGSIFQTSSQISGTVSSDWNHYIGSMLDALLPAGSISGAPKEMTCRIIRKAEIDNRGFYTGVFGIFDGTSIDCAVNIRFIEKQNNNKLIYRSGGGITSHSVAIDEYNEVVNKVYLPF